MKKTCFFTVLISFFYVSWLICAEPVTILQVWPRIITPGTSPGQNDYFFIKYTNPEFNEIKLRIFDITGCSIKEINVYNPVPSVDGNSWMFCWDGTDNAYICVQPGVYVYQLESLDKTIKGTVTVAR
jgi:hypothetical protein